MPEQTPKPKPVSKTKKVMLAFAFNVFCTWIIWPHSLFADLVVLLMLAVWTTLTTSYIMFGPDMFHKLRGSKSLLGGMANGLNEWSKRKR